MKENFADYETAKMLKELRYTEKCFSYYNATNTERIEFTELDSEGEYEVYWNKQKNNDYVTAPLWQQVKQWLFDKHEIWNEITVYNDSDEFRVITYTPNDEHEHFCFDELFDSPITAEIEGIKKAVQYLHSQQSLIHE